MFLLAVWTLMLMALIHCGSDLMQKIIQICSEEGENVYTSWMG